MSKKSIFTLLSAVLIISLVLAGCGGQKSSYGDAPKNDPKNQVDEEQITLNFYTWINEENGNWSQVIDAYENENPNVKVKLNVLVENMDSKEYLKKLDLLAAAGDKLDLMMFPNAEDLAKRISAGMVDSINAFIEQEGIDVEEIYNMGPAPAGKDGSYYALPTKHNTYLIMLNKEHLDEAGLPVPTDWTWEDYKAYAKQMTTEDALWFLPAHLGNAF